MLRQILDLDGIEIAESAVQGNISEVDATDLHTLQQFTAEMQTCRRSCDGTLILGIDGLEDLHILRHSRATVDDITGQWGCSQGEKFLFELIVRTVIKESQRTSTARGVVDDLCHHRTIILEEELIADTDLTGRLHEHIPETEVTVQLTQQEHLDLCVGLLLRTIETCGEHLRIVKDKGVFLIEIVEDVAEIEINRITFFVFQVVAFLILLGHLDLATLAVENHQPALVAMGGGLQGDQLLRELKLKL